MIDESERLALADETKRQRVLGDPLDHVDALVADLVIAGPPPQERDDLDDLVRRFSEALLAKLKASRANGRSGWGRDDWEKECQDGLLRHLAKGDPRDVAAYCAFMWHHGWSTQTDEGPAFVLNGIREVLETRGFVHMANGRDIGSLLDAALRRTEPKGVARRD
jgi:hypothetical protein